MSEQDTQVQEATISEGDQSAEDYGLELELDEPSEDVEELKAQLEREQTAKRQILARAKKAEAEAKALKSEQKPQATTDSISAKPADEEIQATVLKAQGMDDELLKELKAIARVRNVDLLTAQKDPIFEVIKERKEADRKAEAARLGASRGSQTAKPKKDVSSKGLSDSEHKELWKQSMGI